jgi:hypothetical protein
MTPEKQGEILAKDEGLALQRHAKPAKASKSLSRYPAPSRTSRPPKESKGELAKVLRRCVTEFNRRIRQRDEHQGQFKCISCPAVLPASVMEAGHFERRGHERLRFDPRNVHGQCHRCNCELGGNRAAYRIAMVELYGLEVVREIESMKGAGGKMRLEEAHQFLRDLLSGKLGI